ncbi:MAG: hemin uptake protein HemP [Tateyamaria sp.]
MNALSKVPEAAAVPDAQHIDTYDARDLVKNGVQASITLDGKVYYLRITRAGKLILTK